MEDDDSIAVMLIKMQIERCELTIKNYPGEENIGVRISAQGKKIMLEDLIKDINYTRKRVELPEIK